MAHVTEVYEEANLTEVAKLDRNQWSLATRARFANFDAIAETPWGTIAARYNGDIVSLFAMDEHLAQQNRIDFPANRAEVDPLNFVAFVATVEAWKALEL